jgi:hypothetical protein
MRRTRLFRSRARSFLPQQVAKLTQQLQSLQCRPPRVSLQLHLQSRPPCLQNRTPLCPLKLFDFVKLNLNNLMDERKPFN